MTTTLCTAWSGGSLGSYRAFPRIRFFPPTRRERASQRLESRITWPMVFGVRTSAHFQRTASSFQTQVFCLLDFIQIFIPVGDLSVQQPETIVPRKLFPLEVHHVYIAKYFLNPASDISVLLQLVHNYRSKTFAGNHKVAVSAMLLSTLFDEASRSSAVVGQIYVQQGYDGGLLSRHGLRFMIALQVWLYPAVPQTDEEMD
ncbi:hypothetical protein BJ165DRAFT_247202 [Panaeolus papilionaceus]|nr:hypothetical protein BJ165DRAFT_247202 [Panaeolus papilionaceus]